MASAKNPKFELIKTDFEIINGVTVYRIRLLRDLGDRKAGTLGGRVQKLSNLSHSGLCWVADEAVVMTDAKVYGDAQIMHGALITDDCDYGHENH